MTFEGLPPGWVAATAGAVCEKIQDGTHFSPKRQLSAGRYSYITAKNVRPEGLDLRNVTFLSETDHRAIYKRCDPKRDDVLLVKDGVNAGNAAMNTLDEEISLLSSVCFLRPYPGVLDGAFLRYYLLSPAASEHLAGKLTGTAIRRIVLHRVRDLPVHVAPLPEQRRIVEAIESHFTRLDDAVATLERVHRNLKRYRVSVLKAAVEGRLVPSEAELARTERRDYEPASVLLERILAERRRRWEASGRKGKYQEPVAPDPSALRALPEGWCWTSVDALTWDAGYGTSQRCTHEGVGPPVLRIPNVQGQAISLDDIKYATEAENLRSEGAVEPGDLLFIRTNGSRGLIGRGAVIIQPLPRVYHFASYLIRLRLLNMDVVPRWMGLAWHTPLLRKQILAEAASSAGQYNVSLRAAITFAVPLPPTAEQQRILSEVERSTSLVDASEQGLDAAGSRCARLRQSILKWAFEGKLADQDPSDEPASALLERIKAERAAATTTKKSRRSNGPQRMTA